MRVIGFAGLATAGKTTAANFLAKAIFDQNLGVPKIRSFAYPLKSAASTIGAEKTERPELYRKFCQVVGSDMMRNPEFCPPHTGPDYWVNVVNDELRRLEKEETKAFDEAPAEPWTNEFIVIFDDVRFQNEADLIKRWGGKVFLVDATDRGVTPPEGDDWRSHESEQFAITAHNSPHARKQFDRIIYSFSNIGATEQLIKRQAAFWTGAKVSHDNSIN